MSDTDFEDFLAQRRAASEAYVSGDPEPATRYAMLLKTFAASRKLDPYSPTAPTLIARRFLNTHEKPQEPKVRSDTAHFQRLTGMHKAMQPGWLRW